MAEEIKTVVAQDDNSKAEASNKAFTPPAGYEGLHALPKEVCLGGIVSKGFQRGSKLLGIPTANIPLENPDDPEQIRVVEKLEAGIYFGWTQIWRSKVPTAQDELDEEDHFEGKVFKTVVSIGWNPYFKNKTKTIEPYVMHKFQHDFYDYYIRVVLCGYLRPELDFTTMENLISAINQDIKLSEELLDREEYSKAKQNGYFVHL